MSKAEQIAKLFGRENFVCSNGWIDGFNACHSFAFHKICGKEKSVDNKCVQDWLNDVWPKVRQGCVDKDIFNAVLTDLLFMFSFIMISMYIFHLRTAKFLNERITVFVCGNMTGIENETLTVIVKSRYSRCFKNVKMLPVNYQHSRKANIRVL